LRIDADFEINHYSDINFGIKLINSLNKLFIKINVTIILMPITTAVSKNPAAINEVPVVDCGGLVTLTMNVHVATFCDESVAEYVTTVSPSLKSPPHGGCDVTVNDPLLSLT
jgi:hypothetical protein